MLTKPKTSSSFDPVTGRRIKSTSCCLQPKIISKSSLSTNHSSSSLSSSIFSSNKKCIIQRQSFIPSFSTSLPPSLTQKFKRPMTKRRSYDKNADLALRKSSLGQKKRMDGMSKLLARAGKGLSYKLPERKSVDDCDLDSDKDSDDDEKEEDRPFEPLMVWQSPHNGGEAKGLPCTL